MSATEWLNLESQVPTRMEPWCVKGPRRASVNSFGYGGSNAHAILEDTPGYLSSHGLQTPNRTKQSWLPVNSVTPDEDFPDSFVESTVRLTSGSPPSECIHGLSNDSTDGLSNSSTDKARESSINTSPVSTDYKLEFNSDTIEHTIKSQATRLFVFSAVDEVAGKKQAKALAQHLEHRVEQSDSNLLDDLAYTLGERRSNFLWKAAISATSANDIIEKLNGEVEFFMSSKKPIIGFVFTGQGAQWCGMGRELLGSYPVFRRTMERIGAQMTSIGAPFNLLGEPLILLNPE